MATPAWRLAADQRRAERSTATIERVTVRDHGQEALDARLLDVSIYGCRVAVASPADIGERISVRLAGGWPIPANVMWVEGDRMGCRFDKPIPHTLMQDLTRAIS